MKQKYYLVPKVKADYTMYHPGLAEIPAPDGSQEVVVHTHKCSLFIG